MLLYLCNMNFNFSREPTVPLDEPSLYMFGPMGLIGEILHKILQENPKITYNYYSHDIQ